MNRTVLASPEARVRFEELKCWPTEASTILALPMLLRLELYTLERGIIVAVSRGEHLLLPAIPGAM